MSVIGFFDSVGRDVRHALRTLPRRPTFTIAAILTLALGIGATTAIFSVVYSVLIKPLPYPNSDELVRHQAQRFRSSTPTISGPRRRCTSPTATRTARWPRSASGRTAEQTLTRTDGTDRVRSLRVTHGVLQALGVQPQRGRWFTEAEHAPDAEGPDPLILSYAFAQSRFGSDEAALGRDLLINRTAGTSRRRHAARFPLPRHVAATRDHRRHAARPCPGRHRRLRLGRARAAQARRHSGRGRRRPSAHGAALARRLADRAGVQRDPRSDRRTGGSRPSCGRSRTTSSATSRARSGCSWARSVPCCWSRAPTSRTSCSCAPMRGGPSSPCAPRSAPCRHISRESCSSRALVIGAVGGALGLVLAYGGLELLVAIGPTNLPRLEEIAVTRPSSRSRSPFRSYRRSPSARSRRSSTRGRWTCQRSAASRGSSAAASAARRATRSSSSRWRSRSCSS